jgi:preprotein translocase subunit YajC
MHLFALIAQEGESSGSPFSFLILLLLPLLMYFLLIRPQRKRMKQQAALQAEIGQGDEVITTSGIYGFISAVEDDFFWLEIDRDEDDRAVQIRIAKAAVQGKVSPKDEADEPDEAAPSDAEHS